MPLTSKDRARLRSLAHSLKPILQVGAEGVSPAFLGSLDEAFRTRELLKVKVLEGAPVSVREAATEIEQGLEDVSTVQTIGRTAVLFRPLPEDDG